MNDKPVLRITDVVKTYHMGKVEVQALRGVSIRVEKSEFVSIMGPSGCGKSTLMHIIGCLDRPTSGDVKLDEVDVDELDDNSLADIRNKKVGFVFQTFNLLPKLSAVENVELPLIYAGVNLEERRKKAGELLEVVGNTFVTGLKWKPARTTDVVQSGGDTKTGKESVLPVEGIFVEIGLLPNTEWIGNALEKTAVGQIKVDSKTHRTSHPRVWAAGDVTDGVYHQNNIAAGDAVKALEDIYMQLRRA